MAANDILANQIVEVEYDGTNFQMVSTLGNLYATTAYVDSSTLQTNGSVTIPVSTGVQNTAHGLGRIPKKIKITSPIYGIGPQSIGFIGTISSVGTYNGTTTSTLYTESGRNYPNWVSTADISTTKIIRLHNWDSFYSSDTLAEATVTFDATNIIINWSSVGYAGTKLLWEAE